MNWTKQTLASSLNQRIDKKTIKADDFVMVADITDKMLEHFQLRWNTFVFSNPSQGEEEYQKLYDHIKESWEEEDEKGD